MIYYLACPYSDPSAETMHRRYKMACIVAARLMEHGIVVFSPLSHSVPVTRYGNLNGTNHEFWMKQDLPLLELCDVMAVLKLPGWEQSRGVQEELEYAKRKCMPVRYLEPHEYLTNSELATLGLFES
jgi:nucleoside 2-deoxyribosyltransferase